MRMRICGGCTRQNMYVVGEVCKGMIRVFTYLLFVCLLSIKNSVARAESYNRSSVVHVMENATREKQRTWNAREIFGILIRWVT